MTALLAGAAKEMHLRNRLRSLEMRNKTALQQSLNEGVSRFLDSVQISQEPWVYKYSLECSKPTLYSSAYACMIKSMLGTLPASNEVLIQWADYFNSFQDADDGLFYDPVIINEIFSDSDWWGGRHLALHMVSAYTALKMRPKKPFSFLSVYYDCKKVDEWLDQFNWDSCDIGISDIDNKIMNIGCLLQYQRDAWNDSHAGKTIVYIKQKLKSKINPSLGVWGSFDARNPSELSRMVQFAYHLLPIFFYDKDFSFDCDKIAGLALKTQNKVGGFGVPLNSSACEDIDSIYLLICLYPYVTNKLKVQIYSSLQKGYLWVLANQVEDGGFVFRLLEPFTYGSDQMRSLQNQGALFPTWFRMLCIAHLVNFLERNEQYKIEKSPGLVF
jgi:hypothetical protein